MGKPTPNILGQVFGRLTVIGPAPSIRQTSGANTAAWACQCSCGTTLVFAANGLRRGNTKSCGCLSRETTARRNFKHGFGARGVEGKLREYEIWCSMKQRCENPNNRAYQWYGGRGITVCDRWQNFENFIADMGLRPSPDLTLERLNNSLGYDPQNCVWAPRKQQSRNRRSNLLINYGGVRVTLAEAVEKAGLPYGVVRGRIQRGWPEYLWFAPLGETLRSRPMIRTILQEPRNA